jgi:hypothetical protein
MLGVSPKSRRNHPETLQFLHNFGHVNYFLMPYANHIKQDKFLKSQTILRATCYK